MQNPRPHTTPTEFEYILCQDLQVIPIYIKSLQALSYIVDIREETGFVWCSLIVVGISYPDSNLDTNQTLS